MLANGAVYDEARALYNQTTIGISWSSMQDLIARVFELMAFGLCPVINRVPDLSLHFEENVHYLGFDTVSEAMEKIKFAKENPEISGRIAKTAYEYVTTNGYSYDDRVETILSTVFGE